MPSTLLSTGGRYFYQTPDRGQEIAERILGIDPRFYRPTGERHVLLRQRKFLSGSDPEHLLDQIDACDQLGHGVLDLQPRVHFEEIEALVLAGDEFDGAGGNS